MRGFIRITPAVGVYAIISLWCGIGMGQSPAPRRLPNVVENAATPAPGSRREGRAPGAFERAIETEFSTDRSVGWPVAAPDTPDAFESVGHELAEPGLPAFDAAAIMRRLQQQEDELRDLRRQMTDRAASAGDGAPGGSETSPFRAAGFNVDAGGASAKTESPKKQEDGWIDMSTDKWTLKPGGHVQMDYPLWAKHTATIPAENYFEFRRLRFMVDGTGYGVYDFRLQVDYEPEAGDNVATPVVDVKDAYLTAHEVPFVQRWRIGNFFVPFGLEQVTNDTNNIFLERSIPTQNIFCGDREVGFATYSHSQDMNTTWCFGAFFDRISESRKEKIDDRQGIRVSSRFTHLLYYDEPSNGRYLVHTGGGLFYTHFYDKLTRFRARPQIHEGPFLIDSGDIGAVDDVTGNVEMATVWGPFSMQSELYMCHVNLAGGDQAKLYGYYVYGSYFLTGENRIYERFGQHGAQFGRNVPFSNFFMVPGCYGPGAWELKARTSNLDLGQLGDGQYNDLTVGLNWYWSERTRVMFEWIHPWTTASTVFGTTQSDILGMRFDFNW